MRVLPFILTALIHFPCSIHAQSDEDKQNVLQQSIDLGSLQQYYHQELEDRKPLYIENNGVIQSTVRLFKFDQPVEIWKKKELFFYQKQAYLVFDSFEISDTHAALSFRYDIEGIQVSVTLNKIDGKWKITSGKITEN